MDPVVEADAELVVPPPAPDTDTVVAVAPPVPEALLLEALDATEALDDEAPWVVEGMPVAEAVAELEVAIEVDRLPWVPPAPLPTGSAGASVSGEEQPMRDMTRKH